MSLPKASPITPLSLPGIHDPSRLNDNMDAINLWSLSISPLVFFVGTPLVGTNPPKPPSNQYIVGFDNPSVTFTAGVASVTFPTAFPNGVMYIGVSNPTGSTTADVFSFGSTTLTGFTLYSSIGGTGPGQASYFALGW